MIKYLTPEAREVRRKLFSYEGGDPFDRACRQLQISRRELDVDMLADQVRHFLHPRNNAKLVKYTGTGGGAMSGTLYVLPGSVLQLGDNTYGGSDQTWTVTCSQQILMIIHAVAGGGSGGLGITNGISGPPSEDCRGGGGGGGGSVSQGTSSSLVPNQTYSVQAGTGDHLGGPGGTTFWTNVTTSTDVVRLAGGTSASGGTAGVGGTGSVGSSLLTGGNGGTGSVFNPNVSGYTQHASAGQSVTPGTGGGGGGGTGDNTMLAPPNNTDPGMNGGNGTASGGATGRPAAAASGEGGAYDAVHTSVGTAPNTSSSGGGGGGYQFGGLISGQWGGGGGGGCSTDVIGGTPFSILGGRGGHGVVVVEFTP